MDDKLSGANTKEKDRTNRRPMLPYRCVFDGAFVDGLVTELAIMCTVGLEGDQMAVNTEKHPVIRGKHAKH